MESEESDKATMDERRGVVVVYFQGCIYMPTDICTIFANAANSNGSSLPPRLPGLSSVLKGLYACSSTSNAPRYTIVALSYHSFWISRGRLQSEVSPWIEQLHCIGFHSVSHKTQSSFCGAKSRRCRCC